MEMLDISKKTAPCFVNFSRLQQISDIQAEIYQNNLETELLKLEKDTADLTHPSYLAEKCDSLQSMSDHLEAVLKERRAIRQRLLRPICQENLPVEAVYHRAIHKIDTSILKVEIVTSALAALFTLVLETKEGGRIIVEVDDKVAKIRNVKVSSRPESFGDSRERVVTFGFDYCYWSVNPEDPHYASQEV
ncbi:hypothetical protein STEG23_005217, partial [Scotinomys teguina]